MTFQADPSGMSDAIAGMAEQLRAGERTGAAAGMELGLPAAVVMAGMGGSAMGGELLRALVAADCPVPITRVRGFGVPAWAGPGTLVVCTSYSGDTAETLACARQAHAQGAALLGVASGGELARLAEELGFPCALVPGGMQPRAALGYLFGAMAGAFAACGLSPDGIAEECAQGVEACDRDAAARAGPAARRERSACLRRGPARCRRLPLEDPVQRERQDARLQPRVPRARPQRDRRLGGRRRPRVRHRRAARRRGARRDPAPDRRHAQELARPHASVVAAVDGHGLSRTARAFSLVATGDWVTYHAALARGVDPTPVDAITALKHALSE